MPELAARLILAAATGFAVASAACGDDLSAYQLYQDGDFIDAAGVAAEDAASADAQAFAAKAYVAAAVLTQDAAARRRWRDAGRERAEAALALDPDHVEARLQLAITLWLESRETGVLDAYLQGLPQRGRELIEDAKRDAPDEPWAYAMLGAWHFEAMRRGGRFARSYLDADLSEGAEAYNRALALDPGDAAIAAQCALSYLALDPVRFREHARIALERALAYPPRDALEAALQDEARELKALMDAGDEEGLETAVARWVEG